MYILIYGYNDDDGATITEEPIITEATFISVLFHGSILGAKGRKGRKGRERGRVGGAACTENISCRRQIANCVQDD